MTEREPMTTANSFSVKRLQPSDIPQIVDYWLKSSKENLERMGADISKMPSADQFGNDLEKIHKIPDKNAKVSYLIWLVNDVSIGFSSLKHIHFGKTGEIHLHMWNSSFTGKGYGAILFCLSVIDFYEKFELQNIKCEPRASNPMPNGMLRKIGFPLVNSYIGASSELSLICELNQYDISLGVAEEYLKSVFNPENPSLGLGNAVVSDS